MIIYLIKLVDKKIDNCNAMIMIPTLYYYYMISISILMLFFAFNQIFNNYLFYLSYKTIAYSLVL